MKAFQVIDTKVKERGITCSELSRRTGIKQEPLRRSLAGARRIAADEFLMLCHELDLKLTDFETVAK